MPVACAGADTLPHSTRADVPAACVEVDTWPHSTRVHLTHGGRVCSGRRIIGSQPLKPVHIHNLSVGFIFTSAEVLLEEE